MCSWCYYNGGAEHEKLVLGTPLRPFYNAIVEQLIFDSY